MNAHAVTSGQFVGSPGAYSVNCAGDYNDNRAGILWCHGTSGRS